MAKIEQKTESRIFSLLRTALLGTPADTTLFSDMNTEEWQQIYRLATDQGVLAFTYDGVKLLPESLQPSLDIRIQWAYNVDHIEKLYAHQKAVAEKVVGFFAKNSIKTLILKGLSNSHLYLKPSHRQSGDIDIYLMGDFERGNELIRQKGVKVKLEYFVHSEFYVKGVNIENHLHFVNPNVNRTGRYVNDKLTALADSSLPHPIVEGALIPSATFSALFLLRHSSWHYARESVKLRDICDWAMFLKNGCTDIDIDLTLQMLRECGLYRYAAILTTIAERYLGISSPIAFDGDYAAISERVKDDILTFDAKKRERRGIVATFIGKITNRISRRWCYKYVVPDGYMDNILYSIKGYLRNPLAIFKAKL